MSAGEALLRVDALRTEVESAGAMARVVDGASFTIRRGETFALLGESGCGKSMTALSLMRLLPEAARIASGSVLLGERDLLALPEATMREVRGGEVGMIFQEPMTSLNPVLTVGQQIVESLQRHAGLAGRAAEERAAELLAAVRIPDPRRRLAEYPFQLSGGMKQRAMIAMALAGEPKLLIADEPTTALDVTIQAQVLDVMRELQSRTGMSILLITHDLGVVAEMADVVAVMYAGEIVEQAPVRDFFTAPRHPYSRKLFASLPAKARRGGILEVIRGTVPPLSRGFVGCRFAERCDWAWDLCHSKAPGWTGTAPGQGVRCHLHSQDSGVRNQDSGGGVPTVAGAANEVGVSPLLNPESRILNPLLKVTDLAVHFPIHKGLLRRVVANVKAVDGVSLAVERGRTLALVGESGCGKTTVGKAILQLAPATDGSVLLEGTDLAQLDRAALRRCRRRMQIIFQDPYSSLNPRMRVAEILEEGMTALAMEGDAASRARRIDELLGQVGLSPEMRPRYPHEFSGGQRQRIAIARALAVNPELIVCDEPTSALDVSVQAQILNLLKRLQQELGLAYLFITHNISVVEYLAHEVAVMYLGRIVERGTVDEVLSSPQHPYTRALLSAVPRPEPGSGRDVIRLAGEMPSPVNPPSGCHFHPRCPQAMDVCRQSYPGDSRFGETHVARCHLYGNG